MRLAQFLPNLKILCFIINRTTCKSKDKTSVVYVSSTRKTSNEEITESRSKPSGSKGKKGISRRNRAKRRAVSISRAKRNANIFIDKTGPATNRIGSLSFSLLNDDTVERGMNCLGSFRSSTDRAIP